MEASGQEVHFSSSGSDTRLSPYKLRSFDISSFDFGHHEDFCLQKITARREAEAEDD